jgi:uncharacterized SAM-binding protein YcdF (DUF218 family)
VRRAYTVGLIRMAFVIAGAGLVRVGATFYLPSPAPGVFDFAPAALVLSGDVDYLRIARAAALQREGRVGFIVVTGAGVGGDNATDLEGEAVRHGAVRERIYTETLSRSTRENLAYAAPIILGHGWRRIALVTSRLHMFRALHAARQVMPAVEWIPVPVPDAGPPSRLRQVRRDEWLKIAGYAVRGWLR